MRLAILPTRREVSAIGARGRARCPVCNFTYLIEDGRRVHDGRAKFATLRYGCESPATTKRPPREELTL